VQLRATIFTVRTANQLIFSFTSGSNLSGQLLFGGQSKHVIVDYAQKQIISDAITVLLPSEYTYQLNVSNQLGKVYDSGSPFWLPIVDCDLSPVQQVCSHRTRILRYRVDNCIQRVSDLFFHYSRPSFEMLALCVPEFLLLFTNTSVKVPADLKTLILTIRGDKESGFYSCWILFAWV
ncbi:hypothetical protein P879_06887, partial [Paragonimus westermani]